MSAIQKGGPCTAKVRNETQRVQTMLRLCSTRFDALGFVPADIVCWLLRQERAGVVSCFAANHFLARGMRLHHNVKAVHSGRSSTWLSIAAALRPTTLTQLVLAGGANGCFVPIHGSLKTCAGASLQFAWLAVSFKGRLEWCIFDKRPQRSSRSWLSYLQQFSSQITV